MKKRLLLINSLFFALALSGCTFANPSSNSKESPSNSISSESPSPSDNGSSTSNSSVSPVVNTYTVSFLNYDNSLLYRTTVEEGLPAIYEADTPTRPETDEYHYEFIGWDKDLTSITSNVATIAQYKAIKKGSTTQEEYGMTRAQKMMYYNGTNGVDNDNTYDTPYGIGRSVNALTDRYIEITNRYNQIFDVNKLVNITWTKTKLRQQEAQVISEDSASKFQEALSVSYGNKSSAQAGVEGIFTFGLETDFNISNDFHINKNSHEIVSKLYQNINGFSIEIEGYNDYRNFRSLLSSKLLEDIKSIEEGKLSTDDFFNFYGTHVVMAGYYGGRIECNYHLMFDDEKISDSMMVNYKTKASASLRAAQVSASASSENNFSIKNDIGIEAEAKVESFTFKGRGGKYISGASETAFMQNYASWVESFNQDEENYSVLVDVPDRALMPIWNLFPVEYSEAATRVLNAFSTKAAQCKNDWLDKCSYVYDDDTVNDTENFAGGNGSESAPYLIANERHLLNIEEHMDAFFELVGDVNISGISNWEPIGGRNLQKAFTGHLDGKGHSIIGLKRTSGIPEINSRSYFGLFGYVGVGGVIQNVNFTKVSVKITGPGNDNGGMRAFYAVVAGKCMGTLKNITTRGSFVYSCCTNGETWMGSMAGYAVNAIISSCKNYISLTADRYASFVGGFVGYAEGGRIEYCTNDANISATGTDWGGAARASLIGAACHKTRPTVLMSNTTNGNVTDKAYDNSSWFTDCSTSTSKTDFATKFDSTY